MRRLVTVTVICAAFLLPVLAAWGAQPPTDRYILVFQDDNLGMYYLDTETIQRQADEDVLLFRYRSVISWRYRDKLLKEVRDRRTRDKIKRWAYSIVTVFYNPADRTAKPAVTVTFTKTDKLLSRTPHNQPFAPVSESPALEAVCDALTRYVTAFPKAVRLVPRTL